MERTYFDICFDVILSRGEGKFSCLNPAQRAAEKILTKYNVAHSSKTTSEMDVTDVSKSSKCALDFGLAQSGNVLLSQVIFSA